MSLFSFECVWKIIKLLQELRLAWQFQEVFPQWIIVGCVTWLLLMVALRVIRMQNQCITWWFLVLSPAHYGSLLLVGFCHILWCLCVRLREWGCVRLCLCIRLLWNICSLVLWLIWKERNTSYFEWVSSKEDFQLHKVKVQVASWVSFLPEFKGMAIYCMMYGSKEVAFSVLCRSPILPNINLSLMGECCW